MAHDDVDDRAETGEAAGEPAPPAGDVPPVEVFADTMPAPVPSVADGHPVDLDAPRPIRPKWIDRVLGKVLGKAVDGLNPDGGRMLP